MEKLISRFPVPSLEQIPEDLRNRIVEIQEKTGFVPNVFLTLAHRPEELRAFMAYHDTPVSYTHLTLPTIYSV